MKRFLIVALLVGGVVFAQEMSNFCTAPPFVGGKNAVVRPNVFLVQDMTGSMLFYAYHNWAEVYNPGFTYYGYANPSYTYDSVYTAGHWFFVMDPTGTGRWSGNRINYAFMDRIDIARKAFTGGKGVAYNDLSRLYFAEPSQQSGFGSKNWYGVVTTDSTERSTGIIRSVADIDSPYYVYDPGAPRFGLLTFSTSSTFYEKVKCTFDSSLISIFRVLNNLDNNNQPTGGTPAGNAIFEAIHFLAFVSGPHFNHFPVNYSWNSAWIGTPRDPWYECIGTDTVSVSCRPTFAIVIGDGGSNSDAAQVNCSHLTWYDSPYGAAYNTFWNYDFDEDYGGTDPFDDCSGPWPNHHRPGDDYAYFAHINDLRPDNNPTYGVPGKQKIDFYSIYLFARGDDNDADSILFRKIAKHGGFIDVVSDTPGTPGYNKYDKTSEYDMDSDGRPDHFYYVTDGQQLEDALTEIFIDVKTISRTTSASAASVTGGGMKGAGLVYQAQFWPRMELPTYDLKWLGTVQSMWLDDSGFVREETQNNLRLNLKDDYVVKMFFSAALNKTVAARFQDTAGVCMESLLVPLDTVPVESLSFVWNAATLLRTSAPDNRNIYTNLSGVLTPFITAQNSIDPHLGFYNGQADSCNKLIEYIRGTDYTGYRRRRFLDNNVWKLGDIIYSQPMLVGPPAELYDLIYGDNSYNDFWNAYDERRLVIYTGANDGMLHAFNSGRYERLGDPFEIAEIDPLGKTLGLEMWGFIPYNLLPHLKWLADTQYCHVNYVDLRPYPSDAKIFTADAEHPNGWGTILVSGMRLGGSPITINTNTYRSSYSCLDVTNPENSGAYPGLMWEFTNNDLGYTMCVPTLVKVEDTWFIVFGSGPQSIYGEITSQQGRIFVLNPLTGALVHTLTIADTAAITNVFAADWGLNYSTELVYFGTYDNHNRGKVYRINTHENTDPTTWTLHQVINMSKPITAEGSVATDESGRLWIYFGCGKYISNPDAANADTMLFVGIKDDTTQGTASTPAFAFNDLVDVTDVRVFDDSVSGLTGVSTFDELIAEVEGEDGWYFRFNDPPGERVITTPVVLGGAVIFTTFIPSDTTTTATGPDLCIGGGGGPSTGNLWALYYTTGTAYKHAILGTETTGEHKKRVGLIGDLPSEPALVIGQKQEKVFIQTSGGLTEIETPLPYNPRGGVMLWRGR